MKNQTIMGARKWCIAAADRLATTAGRSGTLAAGRLGLSAARDAAHA